MCASIMEIASDSWGATEQANQHLQKFSQAKISQQVAEFSAQALIQSLNIGQIVPIGDEEIDHLKKKFLR